MARAATAIERLHSLPEEQRTLGVFRLVHQLGKGGFAPVWLAREVYGTTELRTVAIKLFAPSDDATELQTKTGSRSSRSGSQRRERIFEEARALCQVEHPNIVRFYSIYHDAGEQLIGLVMEYVRGTPLDRRLSDLHDQGRKLPIEEVLNVGVAVASALSAVHQVGLIHRDIKPGNIIEAAGIYKLIDFGIAAAERRDWREGAPTRGKAKKQVLLDDLILEVGTKASLLSETLNPEGSDLGALSGTVGYMDPVCLETMSPATPSSDLYALGATLFQCLAGWVPAAMAARLDGASSLKPEVLDGRSAAPSLAKVDANLPASFVKLVDSLLDPSPARRPRSAEAVAWELERIRREIAGRVRPLPPEDIGPFRGLARFEEQDRDVYLGRAVEIAASLEMIRSRGLLALIGASGSGKSSLARAGVLPAIADGGVGKWPRTWATAVTTPGVDARASLVTALSPFVEGAGSRSAEAMIVALGERVQSSGQGVCLLVDQLEELVTVSSPESRDYAVQLLAQLGAQAIPGVRCVVAARRDLLDPLLALGELGRVLTRGSLLVSPMTDSTWGDVVDQALAAYGYELEDAALRAELLGQLKGTGTAMPLVQFALTQLWERRDKARKRIPRAALKAIGGIAGALEMHADATMAELMAEARASAAAHATVVTPHADADAVARRVLLAMTTPQGTRRTVPQAELERLDALAPAVLERLARARLVVQETEGVTLAHEALLTQWGKLRGWINEAREDRLLAEAIERDAQEWDRAHDVERLWKRRRLVAAVDLAKKGHTELTETSRKFIEAGRAAERQVRLLLGGILAAALLAVGVATSVYIAQTKASAERALASERMAVALRNNAEAQAKAAETARTEAEAQRQRADAAQKLAEEEAATAKEYADRFAKATTSKEMEEIRAAYAKKQAALNPGAASPTQAPQGGAQRAVASTPEAAPAMVRVGEPP
jgi:serine/threonine protein kinase